MRTMKLVAIAAATALAGWAAGALALERAATNVKPAESKSDSSFTMRKGPGDGLAWTVVSGPIFDVRAFYAEFGVELSEATMKGEIGHEPPTIPPPKAGSGKDSPSSVGNAIEAVAYNIKLGKWNRVTRYYREATGSNRDLSAVPWQLNCDVVAYDRVLNPETCGLPDKK